MNEEKYHDCFISDECYRNLMSEPPFLIVACYPRVELAIPGEIGKIGIGYKTFLRFFLMKEMNENRTPVLSDYIS